MHWHSQNSIESTATGTLPDTFDTNSLITRVFPVPQAISMTRAPLAHASRQSRWHCLKGGCMPSLSATAEGAAALNLAPVGNEGKGEVERLPLVQNAAPNLDLHVTPVVWRLKPRKHHLHSPNCSKLICIRVPCSSSRTISTSSWYGL